MPVHLDYTALLEVALDPEAYGQRLTAMLFADQRLRDAWQKARSFAHGAQLPLRLRLDVANEWQSLAWETLRDPADDRLLART